jgi:hypothetical protein
MAASGRFCVSLHFFEQIANAGCQFNCRSAVAGKAAQRLAVERSVATKASHSTNVDYPFPHPLSKKTTLETKYFARFCKHGKNVGNNAALFCPKACSINTEALVLRNLFFLCH